jgi:proteasome accessory factor B
MKQSKTYRLLKLIGLLQAGRGYDVEGLADACGVTRRTIFRDLDILREVGIAIVFDDLDRRYRIPGPAFLPAMKFTADEALAIIALCHEYGGRLPFLEPARAAAVKLETNLPVALRKRLRHAAEAVEMWPSPANPLDGQGEIYQQLLTAVASRQAVRISYHSLAERKDLLLKLYPYKLLFSRRSWYVIGRSDIHREPRTFNLSRISKLEPLRQKFTVPRLFSLQRYLRSAWHLIPEPGRARKIVVRFSPMVAQNVAEVAWHRSQQLKRNADGSLDFIATVSGLNEVSWWILGYGDQAEVLSPLALRQLVAKRALNTARLYVASTQ